MAIIFQNKRIEGTDTGSTMTFPSDRDLTNLPFSCNIPGQFGILTVTDEGGAQKTLKIANEDGQVRFTQGWNAFRNEKRITVGHEISLYKDDETDQYRIIVE